jgi:hypothetical protein
MPDLKSVDSVHPVLGFIVPGMIIKLANHGSLKLESGSRIHQAVTTKFFRP